MQNRIGEKKTHLLYIFYLQVLVRVGTGSSVCCGYRRLIESRLSSVVKDFQGIRGFAG